MSRPRRRVLLVQLPIPQPGMAPAKGNVALAAGYLALMARLRGLDADYQIEILPTREANELSDQGLVATILDRQPDLVGFTCYLWNVNRTLFVAERLKAARPDLFVLLGGPEITADNAWVLSSPCVDFAAIGEGEQTFVELLAALRDGTPPVGIPGLFVQRPPRRVLPPLRKGGTEVVGGMHPTIGTEMVGGAHPTIAHHAERDGYTPRKPLARLDEISSPYLAGILDAAEERMLLLETLRGCVFKCKFCYYPKSYDDLYFLGREKIEANLRHARERGADEVVLLDPTLNQRRDFPEFLKLLADCNPTVPSKNPPGPPLRKGGTEKGAARNGDDRAFTYFGELRAEGITDETARLLREANFTEVEVGLQSIDPRVQELMDRKNNLRAFERGVRAMTEQGIRVKVDLIIGLPGDTVESVRRGIAYVRDNGLYTQVQVFNLAVLPGTAFRQEAAALGLEFQPIPPYYVLRTPTLALPDLHDLMREAQEAFDTEFDPLPPPQIHFPANGNGDGTPHGRPVREWFVDLDVPPSSRARRPAAADRAGAFSLWLRSDDFSRTASDAAAIIVELLRDNPHSTLQIVLESTASPHAITPRVLETLRAACYESTSYLDRFYSISPGRPKGAKRLIVLLPYSSRRTLGDAWIDAICDYAEIVWRGGPATSADDLAEHEYCLAAASAVAY